MPIPVIIKENILRGIGASVLTGLLWLPVARLRADKRRYLATLADLESAATSIEGVVGTRAANALDMDRCRSAESFRRKAGEAIHEVYRDQRGGAFRAHLSRADRLMGQLEDSLADHTGTTAQRRGLADGVAREFRATKLLLKARSSSRLSLMIFGTLPEAEKKEKH